jgi:hypothetical protein
VLFLTDNDLHFETEYFIEIEDTVTRISDGDDCDCFFGPNIQFIKLKLSKTMYFVYNIDFNMKYFINIK